MRSKSKYLKFITVIFLMCVMPLSISAQSFVGLENFEKTKIYTSEVFEDVSDTDWFAGNVSSAYEYEMMNGKGNGKFDPYANITLAESITTAVRNFYIYNNGSPIYFDSIDAGSLWYEPYVSFATIEGITMEEYGDYNAPATRAEFAKILAASVDPIDLEEINIVDDGAIPDVDMNADYANAVYLLYRAGVLSGSDSNGTFNPDSTITRAEAAAIITRIIDPSLRKSVELVGEY